jgi:hypothetical protein
LSSGIEYEQLEGEIHKFTFVKATHATMHEYIDAFNELAEVVPPEGTLRLLLDFRPDGMPAMRYIVEEGKRAIRRDDFFQKIAHLHNDATFPVVMKTATVLLRFNHERRFFQSTEKDIALAWLRE